MSINIILSGCTGVMGNVICEYFRCSSDICIVAGISTCTKTINYDNYTFPIYKSFDDIKEIADVIVDFSNRCLLDDILAYATNKKLGLVLATTGYSNDEEEKIFKFSKNIPIFRCNNLSEGVKITLDILEYATKRLIPKYDVEIIEAHSENKKDAPSGTAKMIQNVIQNSVPYKPNFVFGRKGFSAKKSNDIGIHSIRGGGINGTHSIIFSGKEDLIKIEHVTLSKRVFAETTEKAICFLSKREKGYYIIDDLLNKKE